MSHYDYRQECKAILEWKDPQTGNFHVTDGTYNNSFSQQSPAETWTGCLAWTEGYIRYYTLHRIRFWHGLYTAPLDGNDWWHDHVEPSFGSYGP